MVRCGGDFWGIGVVMCDSELWGIGVVVTSEGIRVLGEVWW